VPRRSRSVIALIAVPLLVLGVASLSGCGTSGPDDADRAAWQTWADGLLDGRDGVSGMMVADASDAGIRMDFPSPQPVTAVELRCIGTDSARFTLHYTGADDAVTATQDIVCHDGGLLTPIAVPTSLGALTAFEASATSPDGEGYWVAIPQQ
jgi:hypothetical protein